MAVRTVKARVELDGEKEYKEAISQLNAGNRTLAAEMKALQAEYKGNADSMEFLTEKGELLQRQLEQQKAKTEEARKMVESASRAYEAAAQAQTEAADKDAEAQAAAAKALADADKKLQQYMTSLYNAEAAESDLTHSIEENNEAIQTSPLNEYTDAIAKVDSESQVLESGLKKLQAELQGNANSTELLAKKGDLLQQQLEKQKEKVGLLQKELSKAKEIYGDDSEEVRKLTVALNDAETAEINLSSAIKEDNGAFVGLGDTVEQLADKLGIQLPEGAKKALNGIQGFSAGTVAKMAVAAAAVAAVVKVIKELGDLTLEVAAKADEYLTESQITGISTEWLQALDYAAPLMDTDAEAIKNAMVKITKAMGDSSDKFDELGVSITDADGNLRSAQDVFWDVVDSLGEIENATERDIAAQDLLGKSYGDLTPLINTGRDAMDGFYKEAEAVGYILSKDQVEALGAVDDAYQRLQLTIDGAKRQVAADFAPAAQQAMELFAGAVQKAGEWLERSGLISNLASILGSAMSILEAIGKTVSNLPGLGSALDTINISLKAVAYTAATVADAFNIIAGLLPRNWGSGMARTALGWNIDKGEMSNLQKLMYNDTSEQLFSYDESLNAWVQKNATGNDNWRGGLTWVGEAGPELVSLPAGSQILNAQDSENIGGNVYIEQVVIDASNIDELNDIVELFRDARVRMRMR